MDMLYYTQTRAFPLVNQNRKELKIMRIVHYSVIEKSTGKRVFVHCRMHKAEEFVQTLPNPENYKIGYKWLSI